jgi:hypothetical protein
MEVKQTEFSDNINKSFAKALKEILETHVIPTYNVKTFDIQMGLFTSDHYGSYKVIYYDDNQKEVCYTIADVIMGEYKTFKSL